MLIVCSNDVHIQVMNLRLGLKVIREGDLNMYNCLHAYVHVKYFSFKFSKAASEFSESLIATQIM